MATDRELAAQLNARSNGKRSTWTIIELEPNAGQYVESPPLALSFSGMPDPEPNETSRGLYKCDIALTMRYDAGHLPAAQAAGIEATKVTVASGLGFVLLTDSRLCGVIHIGHHLAGHMSVDDEEAVVFSFDLADITDVTAEVARGFFKPAIATSVCAYTDSVGYGAVRCVVHEEAQKQRGQAPAATRKVNAGSLLSNLVRAAAPSSSPLASFQANGRLVDPGVHIAVRPRSEASPARQLLLAQFDREFRPIA